MKTTNIRFLNYPIRKIKFMIEDLNIYENLFAMYERNT
jgi:hypothetical protein